MSTEPCLCWSGLPFQIFATRVGSQSKQKQCPSQQIHHKQIQGYATYSSYWLYLRDLNKTETMYLWLLSGHKYLDPGTEFIVIFKGVVTGATTSHWLSDWHCVTLSLVYQCVFTPSSLFTGSLSQTLTQSHVGKTLLEFSTAPSSHNLWHKTVNRLNWIEYYPGPGINYIALLVVYTIGSSLYSIYNVII